MKNFYLILSILFTGALLLIHNVLDIELPHTIMAVAIAVPLFVLPYRQYISYLFFTLPITFGIHGIYIILVTLSLFLRLKNKKPIQYIIPFIFLLLEIISLAFGYTGQINNIDILMYISYMVVFIMTLFYIADNEQSAMCVRYYCYGISFALITLYLRVFLNSELMYDELLGGEMRSGATMGEDDMVEKTSTYIEANANTIAFYSITLFSTVLVGLQRLNINKILNVLLLLVAIAAGVLSFSRSWLIMTVSVTIIYLLISNVRYKLLYVAILGSVLVAGLSYYNALDSISEAYINRFEDSSLQTAGGRTLLFEEYNNFLRNNPQYITFGTGVVNYKDICMCSNSIHNGIQQIYVCQGIAGVLLFLVIMFCYRRRLGNKKIAFILYLPFLAVFAFNQTIQSLNPHALILPFVCAAYMLRLNNDVK